MTKKVEGGRKMPPPFHGPQETIYYHHHQGFPIDPVYAAPHPYKSKKSLVEKINRTLDKFNPKSPPGPSVASSAAWIYPTTFYHPQVYPQVQYYNNHFLDYYEYPVTSPPAKQRGNICACYGTVRSRKTCKTCQQIKSSVPNTVALRKSAESNLKRLSISNIESPPTLKKSSSASLSLKQSPFKEYLDLGSKKSFNAGHLEDEWQDYWGDRGVKIEEVASSALTDLEEIQSEAEESFTSHLKVSEEKSLSKEDIEQIPFANSPDDFSKNLTTFAALKEESSNSVKKSILDPIVNPYELNKASEEQADHRQQHQLAEKENEKEENNKSESETAKFETSASSLDNELKEFVKQRYQKRYRSKFRKSSHLVDDIIIEENEEDLRLEAENNEDMFKKHLKPKSKKEVTFAKSEPKTIIHHVQADQEQSSEDEFNGYAKVVVSQNLAEEILDEIYGKIDTLRTYENSSVGENGAIEAPLENKSLADEILDELYGHNDNEKPKDQNQNGLEENSMYEEISKPDLEQPVIQELAKRFKQKSTKKVSHKSLRSKVGSRSSNLTESTSMSNLFNDTTRLRLQNRPSLSSVFSHEAPITRPKEPPPPPPPVEQVLLPVTPPRKFFPFFTSDELERINSVINGRPEDSIQHQEIELEDTMDEFSSDEFSDDEFDDSATYENLSPKNVYDSVPDLLVEEDSLEEKLSFGPEYGETPPPEVVKIPELVEKAIEKTVIFTSQQEEESVAKAPTNPIMISSSSWINLQGDEPTSSSHRSTNEEAKETSSPIVLTSQSIDVKGSIFTPADLIKSSSLQEIETYDSLEPVKPPRLKKMARIQKQQQELKYQASKDSLEQHLKEKMLKIAVKPQISNPVLVASTLNPNDVEGHRSLSTFNPSDVLSHFEHMSASKKRSKSAEKITFKDLKRYASTSFASLSNIKFNRSSFYEADTSQDSIYEDASKPSSKSPTYSEHIYEEIPERMLNNEDRPLPPIPEISQVSQIETQVATSDNARNGSIFEGASKYEILHYLKDAKNRIGHGDFEIDLENSSSTDDCSSQYSSSGFLGKRNANHRVSAISNVSDSSDDSGIQHRFKVKVADIERTDSGVGSETSKSSKSSVELRRAPSLSKSSDSGSGSGQDVLTCPDCEQELELNEQMCKRCSKRRSERKEIITEIAETEAKYGRDLRIIVEEFYRPMLVAGLLTSDQLAAIFLNVDELIQVNAKFSDLLRDSVYSAFDSGDEDLTSVHVGKLFIDSLSMLRAFESYCTRQASASLLLTTLEKERELLRIFLKVSQMENSMLRRMNLSSFLMVPVQRVTKYPLLLNRLHKVTPTHHPDKDDIKTAQDRIEAALEQMNKDAKDVVNSSKLWKRLQPIMSSSGNNSPSKKSDSEDLSSIKLRKMALEMLGWNSEETRFPLEGRILFTQPNDANWKKVWTVKMASIQTLLCVLSPDNLPEVTSNKELIFPPESTTIKDASLIMVREKNAKYTLVRDPLPMENCVICCEQDWDDCFEIQEFVSKDTYVFKGEEPEDTMMWFKTLQFYTQCLGGWRKRRKGLANIMIDPNLINSTAAMTLESTEEASGGQAASSSSSQS